MFVAKQTDTQEEVLNTDEQIGGQRLHFFTYLGINQATSSAYLVMRSIQSINPEKYYILD